MAKVVISIDKLHKKGEIDKLSNHVYRKEETTVNIETERSYLNEVLIRQHSEEEKLSAFVDKRKADIAPYRTRKMRKDAVIGLSVVMSFGAKQLPENFDLNKWKSKTVRFLCDYFGKENVGSAVLHMDEQTPHIHAFITPIKDNHFNAKSVLGYKGHMEELHEKYYQEIKDLGLEPPVHGLHTPRQRLKEFYAMFEKADLEKLPDIMPGETAQEYRNRAQEYHAISLANINYQKKNHEIDERKVEALSKNNRELFESLNAEIEKNVDYAKQIDQYKKLLSAQSRQAELILEKELAMPIREIRKTVDDARLEDDAIKYSFENDKYREIAIQYQTCKENLMENYIRDVLEKDIDKDSVIEIDDER